MVAPSPGSTETGPAPCGTWEHSRRFVAADLTMEFLLEAGDTLYNPRGVMHYADPSSR